MQREHGTYLNVVYETLISCKVHLHDRRGGVVVRASASQSVD